MWRVGVRFAAGPNKKSLGTSVDLHRSCGNEKEQICTRRFCRSRAVCGEVYWNFLQVHFPLSAPSNPTSRK
jgi:hypothetical protein